MSVQLSVDGRRSQCQWSGGIAEACVQGELPVVGGKQSVGLQSLPTLLVRSRTGNGTDTSIPTGNWHWQLIYRSKYMKNSYGCGRKRNASYSFIFISIQLSMKSLLNTSPLRRNS